MIIVTGDLHRDYDIKKLDEIARISNHPSIVLIAGDFGGIWNQCSKENDGTIKLHQKDMDFIKSLSKYPFKIISCLGNHENYDVINQLPRVDAYGGQIIKLSDNVELLDRGYVYELDGYKFLSVGGAMSMDRRYRIEHKSYWSEETITEADIVRAISSLKAVNNKVDFVLTHTCPSSILEKELSLSRNADPDYISKLKFALENDPSVKLLESLKHKINFTEWYFGHFHVDRDVISENGHKYCCLFNSWKKIN
ncbi:MAG: metallophosphoesterase [Succinivibrio sp.]|jgi:Icc-related predicted phosphoesterase|nr:metallophosphoesterase [Succinivibrio sp.]